MFNNKDPLQYSSTPVKCGKNPLLPVVIILSVVCFLEFCGIIFLIISNKANKDKKAENTTQEIITVEEVSEELTLDNTEEISEEITEEVSEDTTEQITEETTEATTEEAIEVNELTTREYYYLFNSYLNQYNSHVLSEAVNSAYLPQLREIIYTQFIQSVGAVDEANYWDIMYQNYGGTVILSFEPTSEVYLDQPMIDALSEQLSAYGFADTIESAISFSVTETLSIAETGAPVTMFYNTYVIIKSNGQYWIVGRQAQ